MRFLPRIAFLALCGLGQFSLNSCGNTGSIRNVNNSSGNIVAGPGEMNFSQKYNLELSLPIPEHDFLDILRRLNIYYQSCGAMGASIPVTPPQHVQNMDMSRIARCYYIAGDVDSQRHIGERYRAYVDTNGNVVYLENAYSYTGP